MCGRFNVTDDPFMHGLLQGLGVDLGPLPLRTSDDVAPTDTVSIVIEQDGHPVLNDALWWLLLEQTLQGLRPNTRYASFNTRSDKLNTPGSAGFNAFRTHRCIVPVSGFVETQNGKAYAIAGQGEAIALGGLCREWVDSDSGEVVRSCSIITLAPHPKLVPFHAKSMPLILPSDPVVWQRWLRCGEYPAQTLNDLLQPQIPLPLSVTPIEKASLRIPSGETLFIAADLLAG